MKPDWPRSELTARSSVSKELPPFATLDTDSTFATPLNDRVLSNRPMTSPACTRLTPGHDSRVGVDRSNVRVFIGVLLTTATGVKRTIVVFISKASSD